MKLIKLSLQNLIHKPLNLTLSLVLFSLGIGLISLLFNLNKQITQKFESNLAGIDLIIGAKGSPLQLVLNGLYHIDAPTGNIPLKSVKPFLNPKHPLIKTAIPLSLGDSYQGFRIVGTNISLPQLYKAELKSGNWWGKSMEVTLGSTVAETSKLKIGESFFSSHGLTNDSFNIHGHAAFKVVGILKSTGTVCDQLILTSAESIWDVHAHQGQTDANAAPKDAHDEAEHVHKEGEEEHAHDETEHDHKQGEEHDQDSLDEEGKDITTLLIQYKSRTNIQALNMMRNINQNTDMQAAAPAIEINRLFSMMGIGLDALKILAWVIAFVSGLSIFISLYNSLKERKQELGLMRSMGARPVTLFSLIILEGLIIAILGYLLGMFLSHLVLYLSADDVFHAYKYKLNAFSLIREEAGLLIGALVIGFIAAIIPAMQAYRTDIAKVMK